MRKTIACAMSGGVDSLVAAYLLKKLDFNLIGVYMKNWDTYEESGMCNAEEDVYYAESNCRKLNMPFYVANFIKEYWNNVFENILKDYISGLTPNPDILCNKEIKFGCYLEYCLTYLEADFIATGHYAKNSFPIQALADLPPNFGINPHLNLMESRDIIKDQTFFLSNISQKALSKCTFPLADFTKDTVKAIACENGFDKIAAKTESMGMCFVGKRKKFNEFMSQYFNAHSPAFLESAWPKTGSSRQSLYDGDDKNDSASTNFYRCTLVDIISGESIGYLLSPPVFLTIGQRITPSHGTIVREEMHSKKNTKLYIVEKDMKNHILYVAEKWNHPAMYATRFTTGLPHWINPTLQPTQQGLDCFVKHVSIDGYFPCLIQPSLDENGAIRGLSVALKYPSRAITPGQYAVFYKDRICLGNARIYQVDTASSHERFRKYS